MHCSPIPFFTSVVILSRCSPLFFHGCHALYFRHSHCGQSSRAWSGSFRRSRNFCITDKGDKKSLKIPTGSSETSARTRLGAHPPEPPVKHGSQRSEHLPCRTDLLINSTLRCCSFGVRSLAKVDSRKPDMSLLGSSAKRRSKAFY